jgi:hypothetical protein
MIKSIHKSTIGALLLFSATLFAQECRVVTKVRIVDKNKRPVTNVKVEQLKAEIGASPAEVIEISPAPKPAVIILLDSSSSGAGSWKESLEAARQLTDLFSDKIALVSFRVGIEEIAKGRTEVEQLLSKLATRKPKPGGTTLYETLVDVGQKITTKDAALVMIGDGEDNASRISSEQTANIFLNSSLPPIFALVLDYDHQDRRREYFKKIPAATGGFIEYPSSASKVPAAAEELANVVSAPYTLTLQALRPIAKPENLKLEFVGTDGKPKHDVEVMHVVGVGKCE